jgi:hypothetical protein
MNRTMKYAAALALAALFAANGAQAAERSYTTETLHLRFSGGQGVEGWLFMQDVSGKDSRGRFLNGSRSEFRLLMLDHPEGELIPGAPIFSCSVNVPDGMFVTDPGDRDIVQIGQFAQQGAADVTPILDFIHDCNLGPVTLTVDCPFQGQNISQSPRHVTIKQTGKYATNTVSYDISGHRELIICEIIIAAEGDETNEVLQADGWLTRVVDKRIGTGDLFPVEFFRDPTGFLDVRDAAQLARAIRP